MFGQQKSGKKPEGGGRPAPGGQAGFTGTPIIGNQALQRLMAGGGAPVIAASNGVGNAAIQRLLSLGDGGGAGAVPIQRQLTVAGQSLDDATLDGEIAQWGHSTGQAHIRSGLDKLSKMDINFASYGEMLCCAFLHSTGMWNGTDPKPHILVEGGSEVNCHTYALGKEDLGEMPTTQQVAEAAKAVKHEVIMCVTAAGTVAHTGKYQSDTHIEQTLPGGPDWIGTRDQLQQAYPNDTVMTVNEWRAKAAAAGGGGSSATAAAGGGGGAATAAAAPSEARVRSILQQVTLSIKSLPDWAKEGQAEQAKQLFNELDAVGRLQLSRRGPELIRIHADARAVLGAVRGLLPEQTERQ